MSETQKTITFGIGALILALLALATAPRLVSPDAFLDRGEPFFPEFNDPNVARTLSVLEFDEETASARPFQVTNRNGLWILSLIHI